MFNANGYMEPGLHKMSVEEFEAAFVTSFPHSTTRTDILVGFLKHREELSALLQTFEEFVNGSFTTNKNDPNDVDLVVMADAAVVDALSESEQKLLEMLVSGKETQKGYHCDAYFCPTYPEDHPLHSRSRPQRKYWMGEFGYDRCDVPKGIVHMQFEGGV